MPVKAPDQRSQTDLREGARRGLRQDGADDHRQQQDQTQSDDCQTMLSIVTVMSTLDRVR